MHASRVSRCPSAFLADSYWYGGERSGPGRPPQWVDALVEGEAETLQPTVTDKDSEDSAEGDPPELLGVDQEDEEVGPDEPNPPYSPESEHVRGSKRLRSHPNYYGNLVAT